MRVRWLAVGCLVTLASEAAAAGVVLVEKGGARAVLVLPREPAAEETEAAAEIQAHIAMMSGATLDTIPAGEDPGDRLPILVGAAAASDLDAAIRASGDDPCGFILDVTRERVAVRGLSPAGTRIAASELLEQLGVRWYIPGDLGTVVPKAERIELAEQSTVQVPAFSSRWTTTARSLGAAGATWMRRMRMGGPVFPSAHGVRLADRVVEKEEVVRHAEAAAAAAAAGRKFRGSSPDAAATVKENVLFAAHPEYFALIGGRRVQKQLCVSNAEVVQMAINAARNHFRCHPEAPWMGAGPHDGRGFCECTACTALDGGDYDAVAHHGSMTDRYIWFFNRILAGIEDEFPDKKLAFYAYATYMRPPVRERPSPRIVPATAVIGLCRMHGMGNPVCPEKRYEQWLTREWGKLLPEVYNRGYWFNLADPGLAYPMLSRLKTEVPLGKELGVKGWRVETVDCLGAEIPSIYVAARLMWDSTADVDALVDDFCTRFYGPAAAPMREYLRTMDAAVTTADLHTGSSWDIPFVYGPEVRARAATALADAERLATGVHAARVALSRDNFAYTSDFIAMLEGRMAGNYADAKAALDRMDARVTAFAAATPPLITEGPASYLKRFFRRTTEAAHDRTSGGNRLVATLPCEWDFALDPERIGEAIGLWRADVRGGNWQRLRSDRSWSDQGLRYYKGLAWYRQRVVLPAEVAGRRVFVWFGGVDESARAWLNGVPLGESVAGTFQPFEFDATRAMEPGRDNVLVVLVANDKLNELGTGGIVGPVFFYEPKDGLRARPDTGKGPIGDETMETIMLDEKKAGPQPAAKPPAR